MASRSLVPGSKSMVLLEGSRVSVGMLMLHCVRVRRHAQGQNPGQNSKIDGRAGADVYRGVLDRADHESDLMFGEMGVQRQRHSALSDFLGDEEIALAIAEIEIVALQM